MGGLAVKQRVKQSVADCADLAYSGSVRYRSKIMTLAVVPFLLLFGAGCGGLSTSKSVSPLDFLLPGVFHVEQKMHSDPSLQAVPPPQPEPAVLLAGAN